MYSKKALLLGEVETVDLFSVPLLLTVTSEHCGDPKCWCHSRTVKLYGTRVQEHLKNEDGSLTKNVLLEGDKGDCFMVSPWVVEKHAQDLGPLPTRYTILAND